MTPTRYRKKPVEVEAIHYDGSNPDDVVAFMDGRARVEVKKLPGPGRGMHEGIVIHTLEGDMRASVGDWIIRGVQGEFYPCKPDIFEATYEPVEQSHPSELNDTFSGWCRGPDGSDTCTLRRFHEGDCVPVSPSEDSPS